MQTDLADLQWHEAADLLGWALPRGTGWEKGGLWTPRRWLGFAAPRGSLRGADVEAFQRQSGEKHEWLEKASRVGDSGGFLLPCVFEVTFFLVCLSLLPK